MISIQDFQSRVKEIEKLYPLDHPPCLIAVSKNVGIEDIEIAYSAGHRDFGENRVSVLLEKALYFYNKDYQDIRWHFIGNLQSNKLSKLLLVNNLYAIHSIDGLSILKKILTKKTNSNIHLFLQYNTSNESQKSGFNCINDLSEAIALFSNNKSKFILEGLMTMATFRTKELEKSAHECFEKLLDVKNSFPNISMKLSMGMSGDYKIALKYQSNFLRIGTYLFT